MTTKFGPIFFAIAFIFFGIQHFLFVLSVHGPIPGPPWIVHRQLWAAVLGAFFLLVGVVFATKKIMKLTASLLAAVLFLYVLFLYLPGLVGHLHDANRWTSAAELTCFCGAAMAIAGLNTLGRLFYAVPLIVFGVQHFLYARFIAGLIPAWIPYHLFWAYFIGAAFIAAAVSISTKGQGHLAAILLGIMFFLWVIVLHAPRVFAHLQNGNEWTSAFIALAMSGGAWIIAGVL
jgi:uncharacterized membrane protein